MRAEERSGWLLSAPYAAFLLAFAAYPVFFALALVFMRWDLVTEPSFAGLDNVRLLASDTRFWRAVANTFVFLGIHLPLQVATALTLALALNRPLAFRAFWRAAFFLPVVISGAVVPSSGTRCTRPTSASSTACSPESACRRSPGSPIPRWPCPRSR